MHIEWFTFTAQVVNFLVLVGLLRYFLYRPIVRAMDEREAKIAQRLEDAARQHADAEQQAKEYEQKNRDLDQQRGQLLARAKEEVEQKRAELLARARQDIDSLRLTWQQMLEQEQQAFLHDVRESIARRIVAIARRALQDLAGQELESAILACFRERLEAMAEKEVDALSASLSERQQTLMIHTSFEIPEDERRPLLELVKGLVPDNASIRLETSPDLICGIELRTGSYRLGWSVDDYLDNLEHDFLRSLTGRTHEGSRQ